MRHLPTEIYSIGPDRWDRPQFEDAQGRIYVDTNCGHGEPRYCTVYYTVNAYYGEPDTPMPGDWRPTVISE